MSDFIQVIRTLLGAIFKRRSKNRRLIAFAYCKLFFLKKYKKNNSSVDILGYKIFYGDFNTFYYLFKEVFVGETYYTELKKNALIFDVGANIGLTTIYFKLIRPDSRVVSFEPEKANFSILKNNIEVNNFKNVEIHNIAVGRKDGLMSMYVRNGEEGDIGASLDLDLRKDFFEKSELAEEKVKVKKISSFINNNIDLFKIDIEGGEKDVMTDLVSSAKIKNIKKINMEFHIYSNNKLSKFLVQLENNKFSYEILNWQNNINNSFSGQCVIKANKIK